MMFKGCNPNLGCTLILSGPDPVENRTLKTLMKIILLTARDIYLQKHILYFNNYMLPCNQEFYQEKEREKEKEKEKENEDGIIIKRTKKKSTALLSKFEFENIPYFTDFDNGFDTSFLNEENRKMSFVKLTISQGHFNINDKIMNNVDRVNFGK